MPRSEHRVVVVGAGIGGLVSALRLAAHGLAVTVVDAQDGPGGKMRPLPVDGVAVDAGPTVFTMRWVFDELLEELGTTAAQALPPLQPLSILQLSLLGLLVGAACWPFNLLDRWQDGLLQRLPAFSGAAWPGTPGDATAAGWTCTPTLNTRHRPSPISHPGPKGSATSPFARKRLRCTAALRGRTSDPAARRWAA